MTKPIISVENLSKAYRLGLKEEMPDTLTGAIASLLKSPVRKLRALRSLDTFSSRSRAAEAGLYWALKDISFEVQEGEVLGFIGRNGAGKSTLLKILSRITEPTHGRAIIHGRVSSLLEVGTGFHPELSGRDNIYLNGTILGMTKTEIDHKFDEIVDFSGIEQFLDTPIKRYSSGMKVRLAFAVAAHLEPEILIIDEVLAVGDAEFQKKCMGKMRDVASAGRTVLFVSHNMEAVRQLTDRCVALHKGQIVEIGPAGTLIPRYLQRFQANHLIRGDMTRANRPNPLLAREMEFMTLDFTDENPTFKADDPITIKALLRANEPVPRCRISGTIFTEEEVAVGSFFSNELLIGSTPRAGHLCTNLHINQHHLAPGKYFFGLALGTGNNTDGHKDYDIIRDCLPFEILPVSTGSVLSVWPRGWGHVQFSPPQLELAE
jgi:lipopolysaccharide transport system ATP-binding protein